MSVRSRQQRGTQAQNYLADHLRLEGWPYAESTGAGRQGADITGTPGLAWEVKASHEFRVETWLRQAESRPGLPILVYRGNGQGLATIGRWPMILRLEDGLPLLRAAGYGGGLR
jgi:hypothetical protein